MKCAALEVSFLVAGYDYKSEPLVHCSSITITGKDCGGRSGWGLKDRGVHAHGVTLNQACDGSLRRNAISVPWPTFWGAFFTLPRTPSQLELALPPVATLIKQIHIGFSRVSHSPCSFATLCHYLLNTLPSSKSLCGALLLAESKLNSYRASLYIKTMLYHQVQYSYIFCKFGFFWHSG